LLQAAAVALPALATAPQTLAASDTTAGGADAAATYPTKPVRMVVPYPPGGPTDTLARIVAQQLGEDWGQSVIVDYQPGAGTAIGVTNIARSAPDGYSFGIVNSAFV